MHSFFYCMKLLMTKHLFLSSRRQISCRDKCKWHHERVLFLSFFMGIMSFNSCSEWMEDVAREEQNTFLIEAVLTKEHLKVLDIGNSYTNGALALLPTIVKNCNADVSDFCLYKIVRGGSSFKTWCDTYEDKDAHPYSFIHVLGDLQIHVPSGDAVGLDGSLFRRVLSDVEWDIIIIHQLSTYAPYYELWRGAGDGGYLDNLLRIIKQNQPKAIVGFMLIHSYWDEYNGNKEKSSLARWQKIANSVQQLQKDYGIKFVIPYGTAVENLRSSSLNNNYDLTMDGTHCGLGLCQYTAACCYYESLVAPRSGVSCYGTSTQVDVSGKGSQYPVVNVTNTNSIIAQKAALLAVQDMFHCNNPEN